MHCKAKNFKNGPSPLLFSILLFLSPHWCLGNDLTWFLCRKLSPSGNRSLLPPSPNLNVVLGVHVFPPDSPLTVRRRSPISSWPLCSSHPTSLVLTHTSRARGRWCGSPPHRQRPDVPDLAPAGFQGLQFQETTWATAPLPEDAGRPLPWDLSSPFTQYWPLDFCLISWLPGKHRA